MARNKGVESTTAHRPGTTDRSEPTSGSIELRRHRIPALDGLRAVAVAAVMAYHLDFGWAGGGYLGVDLFFVLTGVLITSFLIEERSESQTISLRRFWIRRARRLFPALLVMLG